MPKHGKAHGNTGKARGFVLTVQAACLAAPAPFCWPNWPDFSHDGISYGVAGRETGPKTGNRHFQCYVHFSGPRSFDAVRKLYPGAHVETAKGSAHQCRLYCLKDGDVREVGDPPHQGRRSDLLAMLALVDAGHANATLRIATPSCYLRYSHHIAAYKAAVHRASRTRDVHVSVCYGATGTGKTHDAFEQHDGLWELPPHPGPRLWFDNYDGEDVLLIDDEDFSHWSIQALLKILDRYIRQWEVKGGYVTGTWTMVIICSATHPREWFPNLEGTEYSQLKRRINKCTRYISRTERLSVQL